LRTYNWYIIYLALASCLINTLLAVWGQKDLSVYFVVNVIAYLVITLLYVYLNPRARRALDTIGYMLFGGFMVIVVLKVVEILSGK
jgi:predicted membrane channel-forming protein YqfA (hemolysin III family)